MLNSFLSHLLFGSSSNDNSATTQQQSENLASQDNNHTTGSSTTQSAIRNDNDKYTDVRNDIDWVIIDPSDNDEVKKHLKRKFNSMVQSMQMSEYGLTSLFDTPPQQDHKQYANCGASDGATISDESMLSFDETAQSRPMTPFEPQREEVVPVAAAPQPVVVEQDSWLITPLPSLVSLQTSQKSIIENAPLENLLIEHPSMSVFITQDEVNESELAVADSSFALIDKNENEASQSSDNATQEQKSKKKKQKAKKQQQVELQPSQQQQQQAVNNKENEQRQAKASARLQICNNNKQTSNKLISSSQFLKDRCSYSKLQEKCKYYVKNVNLKQRKCHNLQQPQYLNVNFVNIRH